jgi:hypothetical protein
MNAKKVTVIVVMLAIVGWAIWYQFIREKTLGEKLDDAGRQMERSVDNMLDKVKK